VRRRKISLLLISSEEGTISSSEKGEREKGEREKGEREKGECETTSEKKLW
jgi:hypothetical protein